MGGPRQFNHVHLKDEETLCWNAFCVINRHTKLIRQANRGVVIHFVAIPTTLFLTIPTNASLDPFAISRVNNVNPESI